MYNNETLQRLIQKYGKEGAVNFLKASNCYSEKDNKLEIKGLTVKFSNIFN